MKKQLFLVLFSFLFCNLFSQNKAQQLINQIDWPSFLAQQDLVWEQLPPSWNAGGFVGNGQLGMMVYAALDSNRVDFHLGRQDVTDHRKAPNKKTSVWMAGASPTYDFPRIDLGKMVLVPAGKILSGKMRQSLWNAELTATIITSLGTITFRAITHSTEMLNFIEVKSTEKYTNGKSAPYRWKFLPGYPQSPRGVCKPNEREALTYIKNPEPIFTTIDNVPVCVQALLAGGDYATAWLEKRTSNNQSSIYVSTANEIPAANVSGKVAVKTVKLAASEKLPSFIQKHRAWWHSFYPKSFLSIPDARVEAFYWIQLYKMACSTRENGELVDDAGPFFRINQWPYATWNLNVQLTYWPVYTSNHLELGQSLIKHIDDNFPLIIQRAQASNLSNITWAMHNYWWQLSFAADKKALKESWYPKSVLLLNNYLKLLEKGDDGKLHLPPMESPEYPKTGATDKSKALFKDTNFNLSLCKWLLVKLIEASDLYHIDNPDLSKWKETLAQLAPFPVDENGLMIGSDQPVDISHRHFSHLVGLYPLFMLNPDDKSDRTLVEKSVEHWHKIEGGKALAGYSFTGAAELYSAVGNGDKALANLHGLINATKINYSKLLTNTFYVEGKNPVIETPLSGASAIQDFLLQSWGGKLRVFPAVPTYWKDAVFKDLRGMGAFLVSAKRENGKTSWVAVKSIAGEPCVIKVNDWIGDLHASSAVAVKSLGNGEYEIGLKAGESVILSPKGKTLEAIVKPLTHCPKTINSWGFKKGMIIGNNEIWEVK